MSEVTTGIVLPLFLLIPFSHRDRASLWPWFALVSWICFSRQFQCSSNLPGHGFLRYLHHLRVQSYRSSFLMGQVASNSTS